VKPPTVVLFDIDGTLLSTGGAGGRAWARAFRERFGVDADIERFSESGQTDPDVARATFTGVLGRPPTEAELGQLIMAYVRHLPAEVADSHGYRVMPGAEALLERLAEQGTLCALVTGNIEGAARIKMERAHLNRYFPIGGYGSDASDRAEVTRAAIARAALLHGHDLHASEVAVVGDTPRDVAAARAVGAIGVAVATGAYSVQQLRETDADHVLATLEQGFPGIEL
jgi:phosphoglycolate phosphatase-like HAD superfamily hydrolase